MGNSLEVPEENVKLLTEQVAALAIAVRRLDKPKDKWDKLSTITTLLSGVVIGAAGILATFIYNWHQLTLQDHQESSRQMLQKIQEDARQTLQKIQEDARLQVSKVEVVEKYVGYLTGKEEPAKLAALGSIAAMDPNLAIELAYYTGEKNFAATLISMFNVASPVLNPDASKIFRILAGVTLQMQMDAGKPCSIRLNAPPGDNCTPRAGGLARDATYSFQYAKSSGTPHFIAVGPVCQEGRSATWTTDAGDPSKGTLAIGYNEALFSFDDSGKMTGLGKFVQGWSGVVYCAP